MNSQDILSALQCWTVSSLDEPLDRRVDGGATVGDMVAAEAALDPLEAAIKTEERQMLETALSRLSEREQYMIIRHCLYDQTGPEIAADWAKIASNPAQSQLSGARVLQIVNAGLYKMFLMLGGERGTFRRTAGVSPQVKIPAKVRAGLALR